MLIILCHYLNHDWSMAENSDFGHNSFDPEQSNYHLCVKAHYWLQAWSSCFGMKLHSFKRNCFIWCIFESSVGSYAENLAEKCSNWVFLVWFIFLRRLGWHSSCPFPLQNHWKPHHLIATLPFGTQTFNLFTLNAPSSASVPLPPARSNPIQETLKMF